MAHRMSVDYNEQQWGKLNLQVLIIDTKNYIVFIDNDDDLDWITTKEYDEKGHKDTSKHHDIINKVALLECKPIQHFDKNTKLNYKRLLGESLARSIGDDYIRAASILEHAENYIRERGGELSRKWYLDMAGKTTVMCSLVGAYLWLFREYGVEMFGEKVFYLCLSMVAGALGALLSIIFRMGKENLDCPAGKEIHELESLYRIVAGMLSAFLATLLVRADLFLPVFSKVNNTEIAIVLVGFVAGMNERFAPSILAKFEKNSVNNKSAQ